MTLTAKCIRIFAIAAMIMVLPACVVAASREATDPAAASASGIKVSFKLDPRITRGMYMGDRWVSPPTYIGTQAGKEITVEARVEGLDAGGKLTGASPAWTPEDPDMVRVSPGQGRQVRITVRRAGQSILKVTSPGFSRELSIKATPYMGTAFQVEISQ
jgi:hypothetical protein